MWLLYLRIFSTDNQLFIGPHGAIMGLFCFFFPVRILHIVAIILVFCLIGFIIIVCFSS